MATLSAYTKPPMAIPAIPTWFGVGAFLFLIILITRVPWFGDPKSDFDEQLFSFIGWRMTHGELPFVDLWDRKPFGLFALFAIAHSIGGPSPVAYQIMASGFAFAGAILLYTLARDVTDKITSSVAAGLYLVLIAGYGSQSGQSEIFHVTLMLSMAVLVRDPLHRHAIGRILTAMLLGGLALQVKYTVLPQCAFFGLYALWGQWRNGMRMSQLAILAVSCIFLGLLPTFLVAVFYFSIGHLDSFIFANFTSFFQRLPMPTGRFKVSDIPALAPLMAIAICGLYAALRIHRPRNIPAYVFHLGWFFAASATVFLPSTVYLYYYGALIPSLLLIALPLYDRMGPMRWVPAVFLLVATLVAINPIARYRLTQENRVTAQGLVAAVAPHISQEHCLYIFDGPTVIYRMTNSCIPTRFIYPDHLNNRLEEYALEVDQKTEVQRILNNKPGAVITADKAVTAQNPQSLAVISRELEKNYHQIATFPEGQRKLIVWARNANAQ